MVLYTVEYEELRAGVTASGTEQMWFPGLETFRSGLMDDPEKRALARYGRLLNSPVHRGVQLVRWGAEQIPDEAVPTQQRLRAALVAIIEGKSLNGTRDKIMIALDALLLLDSNIHVQ